MARQMGLSDAGGGSALTVRARYDESARENLVLSASGSLRVEAAHREESEGGQKCLFGLRLCLSTREACRTSSAWGDNVFHHSDRGLGQSLLTFCACRPHEAAMQACRAMIDFSQASQRAEKWPMLLTLGREEVVENLDDEGVFKIFRAGPLVFDELESGSR